jgi:hypothetical protein
VAAHKPHSLPLELQKIIHNVSNPWVYRTATVNTCEGTSGLRSEKLQHIAFSISVPNFIFGYALLRFGTLMDIYQLC